jgi:cyclopropane-fatty-acyl-phospholipid synthase
MNTKSMSAPAGVTVASHTSAKPPASARLIIKMLQGLKHGALLLQRPDGAHQLFGDGSFPIVLELKNWKLCAAAMRSGDIGFAESFIAGDWKTDNLAGLIELLIRNRDDIEQLVYGSWWGSLVYRLKHLMNRNSRAGSRKNIHAHYDIGNTFYQLWLDPTMTYSSAIFRAGDGGDLATAQMAKYRRIVGQLDLQPGARVLEIGCGWGGFAQTAASEAGAHVTGLTLSTEQLAYAQRRMADAGLSQQADLRLCDYRDSSGQYDAIASIEMFEAVGESYWSELLSNAWRAT